MILYSSTKSKYSLECLLRKFQYFLLIIRDVIASYYMYIALSELACVQVSTS